MLYKHAYNTTYSYVLQHMNIVVQHMNIVKPVNIVHHMNIAECHRWVVSNFQSGHPCSSPSPNHYSIRLDPGTAGAYLSLHHSSLVPQSS